MIVSSLDYVSYYCFSRGFILIMGTWVTIITSDVCHHCYLKHFRFQQQWPALYSARSMLSRRCSSTSAAGITVAGPAATPSVPCVGRQIA